MTPTYVPATKEQQDACNAHWARIRKGLPPLRFPPLPPGISIEVTADEAADVERFKTRRREALSQKAS